MAASRNRELVECRIRHGQINPFRGCQDAPCYYYVGSTMHWLAEIDKCIHAHSRTVDQYDSSGMCCGVWCTKRPLEEMG